MKIAFIGGRDFRRSCGIANYMYHLSSQLAARKYDVVVYSESDVNSVSVENGFKVVRWKSPRSKYLCKPWLGLKSTCHAIFKEHADVLHYNGGGPMLLGSGLPALCGKKAVMLGHGLEWRRTKYGKCARFLVFCLEALEVLTHRHVLMCSQEQSDYWRRRLGRKCVTMRTAVNVPTDETPSRAVLDRLGVKEGRYFLYLARLTKEKNPDVLIRAFIQANLAGWQLVIAGTSDKGTAFEQSLHALAKDCPAVKFPGAVYGEDKQSLLAHCGAFCLVSSLEGLSIALLEGMSHAKPVVASDIAANREGLGENGIWCQPEDVETLAAALTRVANSDSAALNEIGRRNLQRIKDEFTWERRADQYEDYLRGLMS